MRRFKRGLALFVVIVLMFSLVSCKRREDNGPRGTPQVRKETPWLVDESGLRVNSSFAQALFHAARRAEKNGPSTLPSSVQPVDAQTLLDTIERLRAAGVVPDNVAGILSDGISASPDRCVTYTTAARQEAYSWPVPDLENNRTNRVGCYYTIDPVTGRLTEFTWSGVLQIFPHEPRLTNFVNTLPLEDVTDWEKHSADLYNTSTELWYSPATQICVFSGRGARQINSHTVRVLYMSPEDVRDLLS